jgi:hypothetical protein
MLDLATASRSQLVSVVREARAALGRPPGAASTLARLSKETLIAEIRAAQASAAPEPAMPEAAAEPAPPPAPQPDAAPAAGELVMPKRAAKRKLPPMPAREGVVTVLALGNPKHEGSASHARFALLRSGMTVADYLAAAGPRGRRTLRKAVMQGHVRVDAPTPSAAPVRRFIIRTAL